MTGRIDIQGSGDDVLLGDPVTLKLAHNAPIIQNRDTIA
jgi:hypothetical protein